MKSLYLRVQLLLCTVLLLTACMAPKTPQEVAQGFWASVIAGNASGAVEYSTLVSERDYDAFSRDWSGFQPEWGKVVIEGDEARIFSDFNKGDGQKYEKRSMVTYLVRQNDTWKVDYLRTGESLRGGSLARLFGQLGELGQSLSAQFRSSAKDLDAEFERIGKELSEKSAQLSREARQQLETQSEVLRRRMDELAQSIEQALEEREKRLSEKDRRTLQQVAADLNEGSERLEEPSIQTLAESSKDVTRANLQLEEVDDTAVGETYKRKWHTWYMQVEKELRQGLADFEGALGARE